MALNPLIALQLHTLDTATPARNLVKMKQYQNEQASAQAQAERQSRMDDLTERKYTADVEASERQAAKDREESILISATVLDGYLQKNDIDGGRAYLQARTKSLTDQGLVADDTTEALRMLDENPEQLKTATAAARQEAQLRGYIKDGSIKEKYSHVKQGDDGATYGFNNETNVIEKIPGAVIPQQADKEPPKLIKNDAGEWTPNPGWIEYEKQVSNAKKKGEAPYSNITKGDDGQFYGLSRDSGQMEAIPGDTIPQDAVKVWTAEEVAAAGLPANSIAYTNKDGAPVISYKPDKTPEEKASDLELKQLQIDKGRAELEALQDPEAKRKKKLELEKLEGDIVKQKFDTMSAEEQRRAKNNAIDSYKLSLALEQGPEAAQAFIDQNRVRNAQEGFDSNETFEAERLLREGKIDELKAGLQEAVRVGEAIGVLKTQDDKAPTTREVKSGNKIITEEWDPATKSFKKIAETDKTKEEPLTEVYDPKSPTGTTFVPRSEAAGKPGTPNKGFKVTTADGTTIEYGSSTGGEGLTKPTHNKVQQKVLDTGDVLAQIVDIEKRFKPEYHTLAGKLGGAIKGVKAFINPESLSPEDKKSYQEYRRYIGDLGRMQAQQINELYGAALSEGESKRAEKFVVNENDDSITAKEKLDGYKDLTRRAMMKYAYINKHGLTVDSVGVDDMPSLMQKRGEEISKGLSGKGMNKEAIKTKTRQLLADEFGLSAY